MTESPADEYERTLDGRRERAASEIKAAAALSAALHLAAFVLMFVAVFARWDIAAALSVVCWALSVVAAFLSAVFTYDGRGVVSAWWVVLGLLPGGVIAVEFGLFALGLAARFWL